MSGCSAQKKREIISSACGVAVVASYKAPESSGAFRELHDYSFQSKIQRCYDAYGLCDDSSKLAGTVEKLIEITASQAAGDIVGIGELRDAFGAAAFPVGDLLTFTAGQAIFEAMMERVMFVVNVFEFG